MDKKLLAAIKAMLKDQADAMLEAQQDGLSSSDMMHTLIDAVIGTLEGIDIPPQLTGFSEAEGFVYKTHIKNKWTNIKIRIPDDEAPPSGAFVKISWSTK